MKGAQYVSEGNAIKFEVCTRRDCIRNHINAPIHNIFRRPSLTAAVRGPCPIAPLSNLIIFVQYIMMYLQYNKGLLHDWLLLYRFV